MAQSASTAVSVFVNILLLIVVFIYMPLPWDFLEEKQNTGESLWWAPVYLLNVYLGFRSWRFGESSSLISFLIVNIIQLGLTVWELTPSALAIEMGRIMKTWPPAGGAPSFWDALIALHSIVVVSAIAHFIFSIWGIVVSSGALCGCNCIDCCRCPSDDVGATRPVVKMVVQEGATPGSRILVPAGDGQVVLNSAVYPGTMVPPVTWGQGTVPSAGVHISGITAPAVIAPADVAPIVNYAKA